MAEYGKALGNANRALEQPTIEFRQSREAVSVTLA
jgi:hypothetical protein